MLQSQSQLGRELQKQLQLQKQSQSVVQSQLQSVLQSQSQLGRELQKQLQLQKQSQFVVRSQSQLGRELQKQLQLQKQPQSVLQSQSQSHRELQKQWQQSQFLFQEKEKEEEGLFKSPKSETLPFVSLTHKLFPEDCVAELVASYKQLKFQNKSKEFIIITLLWDLLGLFWAFYIQNKIENICLLKRKADE